MPLVNVMVNARAYTIACDDGEEDHLKQLATYVDGKVRELMESVGQVGDARLLLMAALLLADECFDANAQLEAKGKQLGDLEGSHGEVYERLAFRRAWPPTSSKLLPKNSKTLRRASHTPMRGSWLASPSSVRIADAQGPQWYVTGNRPVRGRGLEHMAPTCTCRPVRIRFQRRWRSRPLIR